MPYIHVPLHLSHVTVLPFVKTEVPHFDTTLNPTNIFYQYGDHRFVFTIIVGGILAAWGLF